MSDSEVSWSEERVGLNPVITIGETEITHRSVSGKRLWGRIDITDEHETVPTFEEIEEDFAGVFKGKAVVETEIGAEWNVHIVGELDFPDDVTQQVVKQDEAAFRSQYENYKRGSAGNK